MRALDEMYASAEKREIKTPEQISQGRFADFGYQIDAVKQGLDCLEKYDGVIIADVVGLGKSIIAATIAYNLTMSRIVVITPPHLKKQWGGYVEKFQLQNVQVVSCGKLEELHHMAPATEPTLYIIDEAHRFRNENTTQYRILHQIVRAKSENKVILLTATPYNNHPKDIYALIKLFQIPGRATLNTVDNLGLRCGQLIAEYNQLEKLGKRKMAPEVKAQLSEVSQRMRTIIEPVVIRRSRVDLAEVKKYAEDLEKQKISFARVQDPELVNYDLGELTEKYCKVLEELNNGEFRGAKYKPLTYLRDKEKFSIEYAPIFRFNRTQQLNMAKLARRLFVLRFESSQDAFRKTLENMIAAHRMSVELWQQEKLVAISKNKTLKNLDGVEDERFTIPSGLLRTEFLEDVTADLEWLEKTHQKWFGQDRTKSDPKQERVETIIEELLRENPERKIVIFTSFADTAQYIVQKLRASGFTKVLSYTSASSQVMKDIVTRNFDAAVDWGEREDDYNIIVATDALSEGFNLHRAGVIINYDIPYNPTRVVQRIGRINRIDQRVFDELKIYNLFPTTIGENIVNVKGISSLKMLLMNQVIGNDTKVLTGDEDVEEFLQRQHQTLDADGEVAWDNEYRNIYNAGLETVDSMRKIPLGATITRQRHELKDTSIALVRRGRNVVFLRLTKDDNVEVLAPEKALEILRADEDEGEIKSDQSDSLQKFERELKRPYELLKMLGNHGYALDIIEVLSEACTDEKEYLDKLYEEIRRYDDLCETELQIIARLELGNLKQALQKLRIQIPEWYLDASRAKAEKIESAKAEIVLVENFQ